MSEDPTKIVMRTFIRKSLARRGVDQKTLEDMMQMWEQNYPISLNDLMTRYNDVAKGNVEF